MVAVASSRQRNRAEVTAAIVAAGRDQLAVVGAAGLSVRAVAREIGMVSSAVYRYVASRDDLLTLLIVESYDALGAAVEVAAVPRRGRSPAGRFLASARAVRAWAIANPHEYALLYGSPVPGYVAPSDTIGPAARPTLALVGIVTDAARTGPLAPSVTFCTTARRGLRRELRAIREAAGVDLPDEVVLGLVAAWTQLFGLVSFEVFGQTRNVVEDHAPLFDATVSAMATAIGLSDEPCRLTRR